MFIPNENFHVRNEISSPRSFLSVNSLVSGRVSRALKENLSKLVRISKMAHSLKKLKEDKKKIKRRLNIFDKLKISMMKKIKAFD